jgi:Peptidase family M1 domain
MMFKKILPIALLASNGLWAQQILNNPGSNHGNKFEQLGTILPTPSHTRTASGAPGAAYWQQRADYDIQCYLDEEKLNLKGSEKITYHNNSPDTLTYLWLQLDENGSSNQSGKNAGYEYSTKLNSRIYKEQAQTFPEKDNGLGVNILKVSNATGQAMAYTINKTMMRIDLEKPLKPGEKLVFSIDWNYNIINRGEHGGRGGYENFEDNNQKLFTMTQWFPRLCVYSDFQGWQNHQFSGRAEFALNFGNYKVSINTPADHMVAGTGQCKNYEQTLTPTQLARWKKAQNSTEPIEIVTLEEAKANENSQSQQRKTWVFEAENVRDFAWTSSRKFIWDAMPQQIAENKNKVMCMSFYSKESYGLFRPYSTKAVAHTIKTYSDFTIPYPYPVAQSIDGDQGMEYPMICFNYGRTDANGNYSEAMKNGMIGVIIHEVGHNFFPMIINSDERQWSWMDEGLNSFIEYLTEELWDSKFPSRRGPAHMITDYMRLPKDQLEPIMSNSDNIIQFGPNAYFKPCTALNILRETVMGRELFDKAFKTYSQRWAFKHPEPADFFRTMEDASAEDLDWFWRGWFYGTDPVDIALESVKTAEMDPEMLPLKEEMQQKSLDKPQVNSGVDITKLRNLNDPKIKFKTDLDPKLQDFYYRYDRGLESIDTSFKYQYTKSEAQVLSDDEKAKLKNIKAYELNFTNKGGLVMPIVVEFTFEDGSKITDRISAQIWRKDEKKCSKTYFFDQKVTGIQLDPLKETADIDTSNHTWGQANATEMSKFGVFKRKLIKKQDNNGVITPMEAAKKKS